MGQHQPVVLGVARAIRHRLDGAESFCCRPDRALRRCPAVPALASAIGRDVKGKVSPALYIAGIVLAFVDARIAGAIYLLVALLWLIPDRRIERVVRRL